MISVVISLSFLGAVTGLWLISLNVTFRDNDGAFKDMTANGMQMFTLHNLDLCKSLLVLSLGEVITGMEMKGNLKECRAVGS